MWGRSLLQMLTRAGFTGAAIHGWTGYHTSAQTEGVLVTALKPAVVPQKKEKLPCNSSP